MSSTMGMDIRLPMGLLFLYIGVRLVMFGAVTNNDPMYAEHSLGININLWWGMILALFGLVNLALTWWAKGQSKA